MSKPNEKKEKKNEEWKSKQMRASESYRTGS